MQLDPSAIVKRNHAWSRLDRKTQAGFLLANLVNVGPLYESLRLLFGENVLSRSQDPWARFFSHVAPMHLLLTAIMTFLMMDVFVLRASKAAWWFVMCIVCGICVPDAFAGMIFWRISGSFFPVPVFVAAFLFFSLLLVRKYAWSREA